MPTAEWPTARSRVVRWRLATAVMTLAVLCTGRVDAQSARRVVSINTCTDQLVLALAEPSQILGLSRFSRNAEMSFLASEAGAFPRLRGSAEEVLRAAPDVVLAGAFSGRTTREFLIARGVRVETFVPPRTIGEARAEILRAGEILGQAQVGARLVGEIDRALAIADVAAKTRRSVSVLAIQRRGFVAGRSTLISSVLEAWGIENVADRLGIESVGHGSLEAIVKLGPDALVVEGLAQAADQSTAVLHHPALARAYPPRRRIALPVAEVTCGGPSLPALIARIGAAAEGLRD